ncbi:hypothetical protein MHLP_02065 [Candidatus Mycoplasma haematolamae str. Purdue]|uniref:Uncharacterized protein n=1 Tax=Mycoplasma haematolamae (strain Purdue) TaxID=1212765 RepID=I7BJG9_MYCHA|nr:hypothetical protein [Candidatus Mycoplasma haematolamae]AFO51993.1 hypothetical protein MHLP_02065 [Candidatus Mycoplasma haematolamae str. Purdue]
MNFPVRAALVALTGAGAVSGGGIVAYQQVTGGWPSLTFIKGKKTGIKSFPVGDFVDPASPLTEQKIFRSLLHSMSDDEEEIPVSKDGYPLNKDKKSGETPDKLDIPPEGDMDDILEGELENTELPPVQGEIKGRLILTSGVDNFWGHSYGLKAVDKLEPKRDGEVSIPYWSRKEPHELKSFLDNINNNAAVSNGSFKGLLEELLNRKNSFKAKFGAQTFESLKALLETSIRKAE